MKEHDIQPDTLYVLDAGGYQYTPGWADAILQAKYGPLDTSRGNASPGGLAQLLRDANKPGLDGKPR